MNCAVLPRGTQGTAISHASVHGFGDPFLPPLARAFRIVVLRRQLTLIGATTGFSGVILALLLNAVVQEISKERSEMKRALRVNAALLGELEDRLLTVKISSEGILKRIESKGLATEKFNKDDCKTVVALAADVARNESVFEQRLFPEARKELLVFPPNVYHVLVGGYRTAFLQERAFKNLVTQETCEGGELKDEMRDAEMGVMNKLRPTLPRSNARWMPQQNFCSAIEQPAQRAVTLSQIPGKKVPLASRWALFAGRGNRVTT